MSRITFILLTFVLMAPVNEIAGQGISFDAGLTPPQGRVLLRTQYRQVMASGATMSATTHMVPLVVAYGVGSGVTLMARNMYLTGRSVTET